MAFSVQNREPAKQQSQIAYWTPNEYTVVVPQADFVVLPVSGDFFRVQSLVAGNPNVTLLVEIAPLGTNNFVAYSKGQGYKMNIQQDLRNPLGFLGITIRNPTTADMRVKVLVGYQVGGAFTDDTLNILAGTEGTPIPFIKQRTLLVGYAGNTIGANQTVTFSALPGGCYYRDKIQISNRDTNLVLLVRDSNGYDVGEVPPRTSYQLETSDLVRVFNPNSQALSVAISETFFAV